MRLFVDTADKHAENQKGEIKASRAERPAPADESVGDFLTVWQQLRRQSLRFACFP